MSADVTELDNAIVAEVRSQRWEWSSGNDADRLRTLSELVDETSEALADGPALRVTLSSGEASATELLEALREMRGERWLPGGDAGSLLMNLLTKLSNVIKSGDEITNK